MQEFRFEPFDFPAGTDALRREVREFIAEEVEAGSFSPSRCNWTSFDPDFSRKCAERGYIGMTWPKEYGGGEYDSIEKYVVTEELLAAGAPVGAHWIADRQSGPNILQNGSDAARNEILPKIVAGQCFFGIGMSEPNSGSDLAAVRTRAQKVDGGWQINGTKIWTSSAHRVHYLIALCRSSPLEDDRHAGLTQYIIDLSEPGLSINPIYNMAGNHDFNEVVFDDYFVPDEMVVGKPGSGWKMVTGELAYERSGPDRFMSTYQILVQMIRSAGGEPDDRVLEMTGRLVSHFATLRQMSTSIAGMLDQGEAPNLEAAVVKDIGTTFEREIPEIARLVVPVEPDPDSDDPFTQSLALTTMVAPSFTIRGGTREILRGIIAKGLGLR